MRSLKSGGKLQRNTFPKELEKILAQHRANDKKYIYKLEVYWKAFLAFICGSPKSMKTSWQDEENEAGPNETAQEEEVQVEEPLIHKGKG